MMKTSVPIARVVASAVAALLLLSACGDSSSVGSDVKVGSGSGQGAVRDPASTTTAPIEPGAQRPPNTTAVTQPPTTAATVRPAQQPVVTAPPQTAPPQTAPPDTAPPDTAPATQAPPGAAYVIQIKDSPPFDPDPSTVAPGTTVTWKNVTSQKRQVQATNGAFVSGDIAPGASFSWVVNVAAGTTIEYRDPTRPYGRGTLQVR